MRINDTARIRVQINGVRQSMANVRANVHAALCQVIGHAMLHGASPLGTLLLTNTKGANQAGIIAWLEQHGPFAVDRGAGDANFSKNRRKAIEAEFDIPSGDNTAERVDAVERYIEQLNEAEQWWEAAQKRQKTEADTYSAIDDARKMVETLAKRVKRAKADDKDVDGADVVRFLQDALAKFTAEAALSLFVLSPPSPLSTKAEPYR